MIKKLPLTAEPYERETLLSFFSRMAQINGTEATDFALDLGISFKRILEQDALAIETFAARSGLTPEQCATLLSWTGERVGDVRMLFRGEVFVSRALRNPVVRGCPQCLREQAEGQDHPLRYMSLSGD